MAEKNLTKNYHPKKCPRCRTVFAPKSGCQKRCRDCAIEFYRERQRKRHANFTPEQRERQRKAKVKWYLKRKPSLAKKCPDCERGFDAKRSDQKRCADCAIERKRELSRIRQGNLTPEERRFRIKEWRRNLCPEKRERYLENERKRQRIRYAGISPEEYEKMLECNRKNRRQRRKIAAHESLAKLIRELQQIQKEVNNAKQRRLENAG